jgi:hypothetical protein
MKRPPITKGKWTAIINNPLSVLQGHTIKAKDAAHTPVAEAFKGRGASPKGQAEQLANAKAIAALPNLLEALEQIHTWLVQPATDGATLEYMQATVKSSLKKAGYVFD